MAERNYLRERLGPELYDDIERYNQFLHDENSRGGSLSPKGIIAGAKRMEDAEITAMVNAGVAVRIA